MSRQELGPAADYLASGFLSALPIIPCRAFEDWLERRRADVETALEEAVLRAWGRFSNEQAWDDAARTARLLLQIKPTDEQALRNLLLSRGMAGRVQEALAEYGTFEKRMNAGERSSWTPQRKTTQLVQRLNELRETNGLRTPTDSPTPIPDPPLCGRTEELAVLSDVIVEDHPSSLSTVLVTGAPGIGKTRLVDEALRIAHMRGFRILRAASSEFESEIPLNPLLEALDCSMADGVIERLEDPWRSVLLSLMPQLQEDVDSLPTIPYLDPGKVAWRTYEAIRRVLVQMARETPLLLFLDDLQWADDTSIAALEFLRRRWTSGRLVLILALRRIGSGQECPPNAFANSITDSPDGLCLTLKELSGEIIEALVRQVAGERLTVEEKREVAFLSGGNPFFTIELTHDCIQGEKCLGSTVEQAFRVPRSIRQLLERRLQALKPTERTALETLVVQDRERSFDALAGLLNCRRHMCASVLDRLEKMRLISWTRTGITVRHELIRRTVYGGLTPGKRAFLHERVGEWLLAHGDSSPDELALHFDRAGREDEAFRFALQAAERADASGAVPEAVQFLETALKNASELEARATITGRLGELHYLHRDYSAAADVLEDAVAHFNALERPDDYLQAEIQRLDSLSRLEEVSSDEFAAKAAELKEEARQREHWELVAQLLDVELHTFDRQENVQDVRRVLSEAEEVLEHGSPVARCAAASTLTLHFFYGSSERALFAARSAMAIAREHRLEDWLLKAANRLMATLHLQGLFGTDEGRQTIRTAESCAKKSGDRHLRFGIPLNQGVWYLDTGECHLARSYFERAAEIADEYPSPELQGVLNINFGELEYVEGNLRESIRHFKAASRAVDEGAPTYTAHVATAGLGLCQLGRGRLRAAVEAEQSLPPESDEWVYDRYLVTLLRARLHRRRGRPSSAIRVLSKAASEIRERFVPAWLRLTLERCRIATTWDREEAIRAATEGLAVAQHLNLGVRSGQFEALLENLRERQ